MDANLNTNYAKYQKPLPEMFLDAAKTIENITSSPKDLEKVVMLLKFYSTNRIPSNMANILPDMLLEARKFLSLETSTDYWVEKLSEKDSFWSADAIELAESLCRRKQLDIVILDSVIDRILIETSDEVVSVRI